MATFVAYTPFNIAKPADLAFLDQIGTSWTNSFVLFTATSHDGRCRSRGPAGNSRRCSVFRQADTEDDVSYPGKIHVGLERQAGCLEIAAHSEIVDIELNPGAESLTIGQTRRELIGSERKFVQSHPPQRQIGEIGHGINQTVRRPLLRAKACKLAERPIVCHRLDFSPRYSADLPDRRAPWPSKPSSVSTPTPAAIRSASLPAAGRRSRAQR